MNEFAMFSDGALAVIAGAFYAARGEGAFYDTDLPLAVELATEIDKRSLSVELPWDHGLVGGADWLKEVIAR